MTKYDQSFDVDALKASIEIEIEWDKRKAKDGTILPLPNSETILLHPNSDWRMERQFIKAMIAGYERLTEDGCTLELTIGSDCITVKKVGIE